MNFERRRIDKQPLEALRTVGARQGWLMESADVIRVGFGEAVDRVRLDEGLEAPIDATSSLLRHELAGDDGPPGSGVIAFGALPFDRSAPSRLDVPQFCVTQTSGGEAWVTSLDGSRSWTDALEQASPPVQETQSLRSLTCSRRPTSTRTTWRSPSRYCAPRRSTRWCWRDRCAEPCPRTSTPPRSPNGYITASRAVPSSAFRPATGVASSARHPN